MDNIKGVVKFVTPVTNVSKDPSKPYNLIRIIVQSSSQGQNGSTYTNTLEIQVRERNFNLVQGLMPGMNVDAEFFVNGREYQKRDGGGIGVFVSLDLKSLTIAQQAQYGQSGQPMYGAPAPPPQPVAPQPVPQPSYGVPAPQPQYQQPQPGAGGVIPLPPPAQTQTPMPTEDDLPF